MAIDIVVISLACCAPFMKSLDDELLKNLREAVKQKGISADIKIISAVEVYAGGQLDNVYLKQLLPLVQKYGAAVAPAVFIDGKLTLYGGVPTMEKILGTLMSYGT